jgi:hypothetical protein
LRLTLLYIVKYTLKLELTTSLTELTISMLKLKHNLIKRHSKKVTNSSTFSKSVVIKQLFDYLVDQSIKEEVPQEYQIASDVFGHKGNTDKDINIRVYIHNLRKKLIEYYSKEGVNDEIIFESPKGSYKILFHINKKVRFKKITHFLSPYILIFSLVLIIISSILFFKKDRPLAAELFIWKDLYNSNYPTLIVLGDHYFYHEKNQQGEFNYTRDIRINSDADLEDLLLEHPELKNNIQTTHSTYISKQAPFGLFKILDLLGGGETNIEFQYSSDFKWEHAKNRNLIFIGSFKTQNLLKHVHEKLGVEFNPKDETIYFTGQDSVTTYRSENEEFFKLQYPTFTHFETEDNRHVISFMCIGDIGNYSTLRFLTKLENLNKLSEIVKHFHTPNFRAILKIKGQGLTDFEVSLVDVVPIKENINEIWPK